MQKTSNLNVTGLCAGNAPVTGEFPAQRTSDAEMFPFDDMIMIQEIMWCLPEATNWLNIFSRVILRIIHKLLQPLLPKWTGVWQHASFFCLNAAQCINQCEKTLHMKRLLSLAKTSLSHKIENGHMTRNQWVNRNNYICWNLVIRYFLIRVYMIQPLWYFVYQILLRVKVDNVKPLSIGL